ncbi:MAG: PEP-CTERM sorting domain-containing protein [Pirellulales bacterium]
MKNSNRFIAIGTLLCVAASMLAVAPPATAVIMNPLDSSAFTYQYNGDTIPTTTGGLGNTGYGTGTQPGDIVNLDLSTSGGILETTPTSSSSCVAATPCTKFSYTSSVIGGGDTFVGSGDTWDTSISNATGSTWEVRMRQKTTAEMPPSTQPGTLSQLNRFLMRTGDATDGLQLQVDANALAYPSSGGSVGIANNDGAMHTYRMAQAANSDQTDFWFDGVHKGTFTASAAFRNHQWGNPFGWTTGWYVDYVRWTPGGYSPVPEPASVALLLLGTVAALGCWRRR